MAVNKYDVGMEFAERIPSNSDYSKVNYFCKLIGAYCKFRKSASVLSIYNKSVIKEKTEILYPV